MFKKSNNVDLSIEEFKEKLANEPGVIIDVRTKDEYDEGHLVMAEGQYDLLNGDFQKQVSNFDKDTTYYLYCRSGNRSGQAARIMQTEGFEKAYNIGGYQELAGAGFDTE